MASQPNDVRGRRGRIARYEVAGISLIAQKRQLPIILETRPLANDLVCVNAGQRGLSVRLEPHAIVETLKATVAPVVA